MPLCREAELQLCVQKELKARVPSPPDPNVSDQTIVGEIETHLELEQFSIEMAEEKFVEDNPDYLGPPLFGLYPNGLYPNGLSLNGLQGQLHYPQLDYL